MAKIIIEASSLSELFATVDGMRNATAVARVMQTPQPVNAESSEEDEGSSDNTAPAVDSTGLPWDERIHAGSKARTENGVWRKKRSVSDDLVASVEAELRARIGSQPAPVAPQPAPAAPVEVMPIMPAVQPPMTQPAPAAPVMPPMPTNLPDFPTTPIAQPAPAAPAPAMDFNTFITRVTQLMQTPNPNSGGAPYITPDTLTRLNQAMQIGNVTLLGGEPARIPEAVKFLRDNHSWID